MFVSLRFDVRVGAIRRGECHVVFSTTSYLDTPAGGASLLSMYNAESEVSFKSVKLVKVLSHTCPFKGVESTCIVPHNPTTSIHIVHD